MPIKEIILRDAQMCAYAAGDVEHFKYLMRSLEYIFKSSVWLEVQVPGYRYYHNLAKWMKCFLRIRLDIMWICLGWCIHIFILRIFGT